MNRQQQVKIWLGAIVVFGLLLYLLGDVLAPFVLGLAVAYIFDPLADRLERLGLSRTLATTVITIGFFVTAIAGLLLLIPLLQSQFTGFAQRLPDYVESLRAFVMPILERMEASLGPEDVSQIREAATSYAGTAIEWLGGLVGRLWQGGMALFNVISFLLITPLVTFYMIRDWDRFVAKINGWLPKPFAETIREQVREIDRTLAGFARGQGSVCIILGIMYAAGLMAVGLDFGIVVGLLAGIISFIPYFGSIVGLALSLAIAAAQFGDLLHIGLVVAVFAVGQFLEGNFLTPRLVGRSVGLHPVWIIFALLAGGALFGFTGVVLAVPVSAAIGVLVRFAVREYLDSRLYQGDPAEAADSEPRE